MRIFIGSPIGITPEIETMAKSLSYLPGLRFTGINNFHLTYLFLGKIDVNKARHIIEQLKKISGNKISARFSGIRYFPNVQIPRLIAIIPESPYFMNLHNSILGLLPEYKNIDRQFSPHITVARLKNGTLLPDISKLGNIHGILSIDQICLFKSTLTHEGSLYERVYCKRLA